MSVKAFVDQLWVILEDGCRCSDFHESGCPFEESVMVRRRQRGNRFRRRVTRGSKRLYTPRMKTRY